MVLTGATMTLQMAYDLSFWILLFDIYRNGDEFLLTIRKQKVRETTAIIAMFLDATSGRNVRDNATLEALLSRDIQHFFERCMRILIPYISDTLSSWTDDLRSLVETTGGNPASTTTISKSKVTTTTTTTQPRSRIKSRLSIAKTPTLPRLSTQIEQRLSRLHQLQTLELPTMRNKAAATAASLIAARGDVIERTIVLLERTKHGSLSRATKARADYLATVAECISAKVQYVHPHALSLSPLLSSVQCLQKDKL